MISICFHWLLTYLVHSSLLLGCASLLDWRRRLTAYGMSSTLWRIALFGGFISASLQPQLQALFADQQYGAVLSAPRDFAAGSIHALALPPLQADAIDIAPLLVPAWLGIVLCGVAYLFVRWIRVRRETGRMPILTFPALVRSAHTLALRARTPKPTLRIGAHLHAPLVAPGRAICIPVWMLEQYEMPRLKVALAHEMAHLRRNDNEWRIASRIAAIVGWLQPLNRLATRRLDESAELACDAWAATATGLHRELACSLEDCAVRLGSSTQNPALTIGMAANRFTLLERVTKLLEGSHLNTRLQRAARWSVATLLAIAVIGTFVVVSTLDDDVPPRWLAANGLYQSLRNIDQDVHRSRSVVVTSPQQYVYIRVTEGFSIDGPNQDKGRAGTAVIAETRAGMTRSVRYERGTHSELRLTYSVNGRAQVLDAIGQRWLEAMMPIAAPAFSRL
jgi:beta-lactamase regulating signal transducer with metallopeptidase domain